MNEQAEEGDGGRDEAKEEGEGMELLLAGGELERLDGARGNGEAVFAIEEPIEGMEEEGTVAEGGEAFVGEEARRAEGDDSSTGDLDAQLAGGTAGGDGGEGDGAGDVGPLIHGWRGLVLIGGFAPTGRGGGEEGGNGEPFIGRGRAYGDDGAGNFGTEERLVFHEGAHDGVFGEIADEESFGGLLVGGVGFDELVIGEEKSPFGEEGAQAGLDGGAEPNHEASILLTEVGAQKFPFALEEGPARIGEDESGGIGGNGFALGKVEGAELEIAELQFIGEGREAGLGVAVLWWCFLMAGEKVEDGGLLAGDLDDGGGKSGFAGKGDRLTVFEAQQFIGGEEAAAIPGDDEDGIGLVEPMLSGEFLGAGDILVDIDILDGDEEILILATEVAELVDERGGIAIEEIFLFAGGVGWYGDVDADWAGEVGEVGAGFRGEGVSILGGEVEADEVMNGHKIQAADEGEQEDDLQPAVKPLDAVGVLEGLVPAHRKDQRLDSRTRMASPRTAAVPER